MNYSYAWGGVFRPGNAVDFFQTSRLQPFSSEENGFNRTNAWWLSELSRLIYVKGETVADAASQTVRRNQFLQQVGLEERWFYNGKHLQCAIYSPRSKQRQKFSVLVFRGTKGDFSSWLFNLSSVLSPWPSGGRVHKGFKILLLEAWEDIEQQLKTISGPLYYTGHSLGGALAVLAASLKAPDAVYTFGAPRLGNLDFIQRTQQLSIYRVVNSRDIVTAIPPIPDIQHVGDVHCLASSKLSKTQRSWFEAPRFLTDHSPANYTVLL